MQGFLLVWAMPQAMLFRTDSLDSRGVAVFVVCIGLAAVGTERCRPDTRSGILVISNPVVRCHGGGRAAARTLPEVWLCNLTISGGIRRGRLRSDDREEGRKGAPLAGTGPFA